MPGTYLPIIAAPLPSASGYALQQSRKGAGSTDERKRSHDKRAGAISTQWCATDEAFSASGACRKAAIKEQEIAEEHAAPGC
jgi:hypothetical protein